MTNKHSIISIIILCLLLPQSSMAIELDSGNIQLYAELFSVLNIVLLITSIIGIKQYFFPGDDNRMPFHFFNLIFGILFYCISLPYLIVNKEYYEGYQELIPLDIIGKFFFSITLSAARQWVILFSMFINILYIRKYYKDYYESGMGLTVDRDKETIASSPATVPETSTTNENEVVAPPVEDAPNSEEAENDVA